VSRSIFEENFRTTGVKHRCVHELLEHFQDSFVD